MRTSLRSRRWLPLSSSFSLGDTTGRILRLPRQAWPIRPARRGDSRPDDPRQDAEAALQALVDRLGAPAVNIPDNGPAPRIVPASQHRKTSRRTIAAVLPVMPSWSMSQSATAAASSKIRTRRLRMTGCRSWVAIGARHSARDGAAIGLRANGQTERRVLALQADGSAICTVRACGRRFARSCR